MSWVLAHNLQSRVDSIHAVYPNMTIGSVGDPAHQNEQSDHNPDACGVVHAIDPMVSAGTDAANRILAWLLSAPSDLEYVIHNRVIYERINDWRGDPYTEDDPHTNHIHASGKHGSSCWSSHTGVGYDHDAEKITPVGLSVPTTKGADVSAFYLKGFPNTPSGLDDRLHVSDNGTTGYHVLEQQGYLGKAFPGAIRITSSDTPVGWNYEKIIHQLFGSPAELMTDEQVESLAEKIVAGIGPIEKQTIIEAVREAMTANWRLEFDAE
jgi:hypothetical protein